MYVYSSLQSVLAQYNALSTPKTGSAADFAMEMEVAVEVAETTSTAPVGEQTVDDVKKEFYDYLDSLSISPGLSNTPLSVNVTEEAFEKMLADPGYKQRMKDLCARDLCDPAWVGMSPSAINITIDADCEEEYLATSWNSPDGRSKANPDGFWTRNIDKANKKAQEKRAREKRDAEDRDMMKFLQERADERKRMAKDAVSDIAAAGAEA